MIARRCRHDTALDARERRELAEGAPHLEAAPATERGACQREGKGGAMEGREIETCEETAKEERKRRGRESDVRP